MVVKKFTFLSVILTVLVFVFRYDSFQDILLNIDEAEWIYCLKRCISNPIPFLGFDSHTTGPISIYLLAPIKLFNSDLSVVCLRAYGLSFMFILSLFVFNFLVAKYKFIYAIVFTSFLLIRDKDFYAFNTEWMLIPFLFFLVLLSQMRFGSSIKLKLVLLALLNFLLPLIKFQSIIIVFFIALYVLIQFYHKKDFLAVKWYCLINVLFLIIFLILIQSTTGIGEFYFYYIERNMAYASSFATRPIKVIFIEYIYLLFKYFSYHIFFICFLFFSLIFSRKYSFFHLIKSLRFELFLTLVCLLTVFIPKNNFLHYYQFLFIPFTLLIVRLLLILDSNILKNSIYFLSFFLIPFGIRAADKLYDQFIKGSSINALYYEKVDIVGINSILNYIPKKSSVFIFGWHKALPLYYNLRNSNRFTNPSGHTSFLIDLKENKNIYQKEKKNILNVLKHSNVVLDAEHVLEQLQDNEINNALIKSFNPIKVTDSYKFFIRKSN